MGLQPIGRRVAAACAVVISGTAMTLLLPGAAAADHTDPPCGPAADACINLSENLSWLMSDGDVTFGPVPVSHGKPGYETPPGVFQMSFKNRDHHSSIYDAPMPYSVFFNGDIAFHEGSVDQQSHGCVRLPHDAARTYFYDLEPGDVVEVVP
ncbi:MAG: L,D-transpeptidase family protein [Pseudonocardiaceae bacterium]|nr:L,D-transpeptidase family protein [Pseudonocardiaceae bacterium]